MEDNKKPCKTLSWEEVFPDKTAEEIEDIVDAMFDWEEDE